MSFQSFTERTAQFQKLPFLSGDIFARDLDLTEYVLAHSSSCYFIKVKGNGMNPLNIFDGDLLVVDRSLSAKQDDLVVATQNGEFLLMQFAGRAIGQYSFFSNADVDASSQRLAPQLWGVITHVIHHCR